MSAKDGQEAIASHRPQPLDRFLCDRIQLVRAVCLAAALVHKHGAFHQHTSCHTLRCPHRMDQES